MFLTGVVDKGGMVNLSLAGTNPRIREGEHGPEYVVAWGRDTENGKDIAINNVDIDNLKRAKAAIYARVHRFSAKCGVPLEMVEQILIGGSFGKYINVEKAIQIGLFTRHALRPVRLPSKHLRARSAPLHYSDSRNRDRIRDMPHRWLMLSFQQPTPFRCFSHLPCLTPYWYCQFSQCCCCS